MEPKPIPGFPSYSIDKKANVYSDARGPRRILKQMTDPKGYRTVSLPNGRGTYRPTRVHQLMLATFVGPRPPGMVGRHLNDVRTDNRLENLAYGTTSDNMGDRRRNGHVNHGQHHGQTKLNDAKVLEIRRRYAAGEGPVALAREFGIAYQTLWNVATGHTYGHLPGAVKRSPDGKTFIPQPMRKSRKVWMERDELVLLAKAALATKPRLAKKALSLCGSPWGSGGCRRWSPSSPAPS